MDKTYFCDVLSREVALGDIAQIQPGYLSRSRIRATPRGTHYLIQARDVTPNGAISLVTAVRFMPERKAELYLVTEGDILLMARGQSHVAYPVRKDLPPTLASHVFYILRPSAAIRPAYLAWWLNLAPVQSALNTLSQGASIGYLSRPSVEGLSVSLPSIDVQERVERIVGLWEKQKTLQAQIDEKRERLINEICRKAVENTEE